MVNMPNKVQQCAVTFIYQGFKDRTRVVDKDNMVESCGSVYALVEIVKD